MAIPILQMWKLRLREAKWGLPWWSDEILCSQCRGPGFNPWLGN